MGNDVRNCPVDAGTPQTLNISARLSTNRSMCGDSATRYRHRLQREVLQDFLKRTPALCGRMPEPLPHASGDVPQGSIRHSTASR